MTLCSILSATLKRPFYRAFLEDRAEKEERTTGIEPATLSLGS
jgi:hypothetical protein